MISKKDVEHIANLARISLSEEEKSKFTDELSSILQFVEKLDEADTANMEPMTSIDEHINEMRQDAQTDTSLEGKQAEMLAQVPDKKDTWVKVKAIFE